ncbi:oxidoreductase [Melittangium boletus]|uniref:Oxidoreductase n=1 Tax=Melittangium boletus DSM 14713 TaxID=1294270 RepID=A0A250I8U6_9BACT|nr:oxidoreductase [Melittangium boletus]ATB28289.1 oxidoreductase [Melittangium boletus DSM 14713]
MKQDPNITWRRVDAASLDLKGWKIAVIGGTGGLGRAITGVLVSRGASVTVVGQTFRDKGVPGIEFVKADLSLLREAERVAKALPAEQLDLLVFTAGIFAAPKRQETAEGLERDIAVSYLNRLVMLRELAPRLGKGRPAERAKLKPRVFVMGYPGTGQAGTLGDLNADRSYSAMTVHMNTVAGNEMLVLDAAKRYPHATFFGLNPGLIKTNIRDNFFGKDSFKSRFMETLIGFFTPSPETYAARITPLLVSPDLEGHSGALFNQKGFAIMPSPTLADGAHVAKFLAESEALVARATG